MCCGLSAGSATMPLVLVFGMLVLVSGRRIVVLVSVRWTLSVVAVGVRL